MIGFYFASMVVMILTAIFSFQKTGLVNAICAIIIFNFASFLALWHAIHSPEYHAMSEIIRTSFVSVICLHFGFKAKKAFPYLFLAILTLSFSALYCVEFFNLVVVDERNYIALTIFEMIIFANGIIAIHKAKTDEIILNSTNDIHDRDRRVISSGVDAA